MKITLIELNLWCSMATYQSALTSISDFSLLSEVVTTWQTDSAAYKLKPRSIHKSAHLWVHSADFYPSVNCAWQYLLNSLLQFCLQFNFVFCTLKSKIAFSCHNSLTLVPPLRTPFNTILCFSDQMAYLPNAPRYSRQIHQRGHSSPRSPFSTI